MWSGTEEFTGAGGRWTEEAGLIIINSILLDPFYERENWCIEKVSSLPEVSIFVAE